MNNESTSNINFSEWAKRTYAEHHETVEHMKNSSDPLDRAIANRITCVAGVGQ
ncbi:hypothetical protein [Methanosarcina siciliae]|uniref:hypothetical protein n=1 Tax=Methanosarcina siciliae TaxID=38027 RepID=UPI000AFC3C36|nr:hypothetical protein [Methanosarcina siciliae]